MLTPIVGSFRHFGNKQHQIRISLPWFSSTDSVELQVELFALEIFKRADDQYHAGRADKSTAVTFRAAATFMVRSMEVAMTFL
jgi:hypothetical protein